MQAHDTGRFVRSNHLTFETAPYSSVLVVDDEPACLSVIARWLVDLPVRPILLDNATDALREATAAQPQLAVLDYRLPGPTDGLSLGRELRRVFDLPFILVSGYLDTIVTVEAMRAGAVDVLDKPLTQERFLKAIEMAIVGSARHGSPFRSGLSLGPAKRLAALVLSACSSGLDPRTMTIWARSVGASESVIEEACRRCRVRPHDARDLARFIRALSRARLTNDPLILYFDVVDGRTQRKLFERAGVPMDSRSLPLREFFVRQQFASTSEAWVRELAHLAANSEHFR